ncbi:peptidase U35 phage prohead HK97 [Actinobacteria bacterium OV450]|nr:peptidase U35 phage prohead HK97 [Actinobacteria bacterium OV450]
MHKKSLTGVEFKDAGNGEVEAVFATLGVKDHDGDVTLKGAFENGAECRISDWNHTSWGGAKPVGKGCLFEEGDKVVFRGEFFNTQAAQEVREVIKGLGDLCEYSYGFDVVESEPGEHRGEKVRFLKKMKVHEVSPVLLGAGVGTGTRSVKDGEQSTLVEAVEAAAAVIERAERVEALRAEKGLPMTEAARKSLEGLEGPLVRLKTLLAKEEESIEASDEMQRIYLRSLADKFREEHGNA